MKKQNVFETQVKHTFMKNVTLTKIRLENSISFFFGNSLISKEISFNPLNPIGEQNYVM